VNNGEQCEAILQLAYEFTVLVNNGEQCEAILQLAYEFTER